METLIKKTNHYITQKAPTRTSYWEAPVLNIYGTDSVIKTIAKYYGVSAEDIRGKSHTKNLTEPRHVSCHFLFNVFNKKSDYGVRVFTLKDIGREFNRDHATVLNSLRRVREWSETDGDFRARINELEKIFLLK